MIKKFLKDNRGVSLVEMLVAVTIFTIITLSATAIFQQVMKSQRAAIASQNIQESTRYSFEFMSKEIRTALVDDGSYCGNAGRIFTTSADNEELYLLNQYGDCVAYYLEDYIINGSKTIKRLTVERTPFDGGPHWAYVTPDDIAVSNLNFNVTDDPENETSKVTMTMKIVSVDENNPQLLNMQTTVSSRYYGGEVGVAVGTCTDNDGDGYFRESSGCDTEPGFIGHSDCDDTDPDINPGAEEICNDGINNDCDIFSDCNDPDCFAEKVCF